MRRFAAVLLGSVLAAPLALAQAPPTQAPAGKPPGAKPPAGRAPEYDASAVVTIRGIVEDFHESKARGDHPGLHLIVKTETETIEVHACPVRFLSELEFTIEKGEAITVEGSRPGGGEILVAREITKGQTSLILRDKTGAPVWTR